MSQKFYLIILKTGAYISLLSVFLVFRDLLFPFITSKQISFNILMEILLVFWIAFILKYPEYRPKKSWISFGLFGFFAALAISCWTGVDFNLSFWGDIERMLGVFHILHFLILYLIMITVFREWKDWKMLFIFSIICAVIVSFYGLANKHYSTIGNTAYVSGYLIFNIYFSLILFFREKNWTIKPLYLIAIPIMLAEFSKAGTSGAYVGLGASIIVLLFLYGILAKNKKIRICASIIFLLAVLFTGSVFMNKDSDFVKNNSAFSVIRGIDIHKSTFQTRLISWKAALKDFKSHPILGTGHGNFATTFDKYFEPTFYDYTRSETYFDRAHNNLIDIASTTGILGFLTYLSIFIAVAYYLINGFRKEKISLNEFVLLSCLIIAYFIQNLAVFDSLVTYIALMAVLAFIYWLSNGAELTLTEKDKSLDNREIFALAITGIIMLTVIFQYNIKPLKMLKGTIDGQVAFAQNDIVMATEEYKKALSYRTILDRDSRDSFVRAIVSRAHLLGQIDKQKARDILDWAIKLNEKNIKYNQRDSLMQMQFAQLLNLAARFNKDNQDKFYFYSERALSAINKSIELSPGRIPSYFQKAQILAARGENNKAIETLQYAVGLNNNYYDSYCNLAKYYFIFKREEQGFVAMDECIDKGGVSLLSQADYIKYLINHYTDKKDFQKVIQLYERLALLDKKDVKILINLSKLYAQEGETEKAIKAAEKVGEMDPAMKDAVKGFIKSIRN